MFYRFPYFSRGTQNIILLIPNSKLEKRSMEYRTLKRKLSKEPVYMYCDFEEIALRTQIVGEEIEYYIKHRDMHEYKAVNNSRIVALALLSNPEMITRETYENY